MGALNSAAVWGSLAALGVAIPIIIHLLYRKNRKQTDWAAMELLRRALVIRSGQVKIEDLLVLVLRCLALALIALALLRPTLNSDSAQWLGEKKVGMVVAVDASLSMDHGEHSRFERAVESADAILETAREGDPVSLVMLSEKPEILLRGTGYNPSKFAAALEERKTATPFRLNLEQGIIQLEELVMELKTPARECYLITDAGEADWAALSQNGKETFERLSKAANVFIVPVGNDGESNFSVAGLNYSSGSLAKSGIARFTAEVKNEGREKADGGFLEFLVDGERTSRRAIGALESGETRPITLFASFDSPGDIRLKAQLSKDDLTGDNERYAVVSVIDTIDVLCVEGSGSVDGTGTSRGGADYASRALRLKGGSDNPIRVNRVAALDMNLESLSEYDVIVMANVSELSPEMFSRIERFVQRGGGLMIFLGEHAAPETYNVSFGGVGKLMPGELIGTESGRDEFGWEIDGVKSDNLLAGVVGRLPADLLNSARISKVMKVKPANDSEVILTVGAGAHPLLLSRDVGSGKVLLFTSSADRSWNNLPLHPIYTMLLQQAVTNLSSQPDSRLVDVGDLASVDAGGRTVGEEVTTTGPEGYTGALTIKMVEGRATGEIDTTSPGFYEIAADTENPPVAIAANIDASESNVRVIAPAALRANLAATGVNVIAGKGELLSAIEDSRKGREIAQLLLLLGIIAFVAQSILAKIFTSRIGRGDSTDVAATLQLSQVAAARRAK